MTSCVLLFSYVDFQFSSLVGRVAGDLNYVDCIQAVVDKETSSEDEK
jgi:hypothetical protein